MCKRHHDQYQRDKKLEEETRSLMQMKGGKAATTTAAKITAAADADAAKGTLSPEEVDAEVERKVREEMEMGNDDARPSLGADVEDDSKDQAAVGVGAVAEI